MGIRAAVYVMEYIHAAFYATCACSAFRYDDCVGVSGCQTGKEYGVVLVFVFFPADKDQLHAISFSVDEGRGWGGGSFTPDDTYGGKPGVVCDAGRCNDVIGPGSAKSDQAAAAFPGSCGE